MKTMSAFALAMVLATGGALAQGGTETGPSGTSTGKEAGTKPTPQQCAKGWDSSMRTTKAEFDAACSKR